MGCRLWGHTELDMTEATYQQQQQHIFFIYSSVNGHLGYFYILAIVNIAAMNIGLHVCF